MDGLQNLIIEWQKWLSDQSSFLWIRPSDIQSRNDLATAFLGVRRCGKTAQAVLLALKEHKNKILYMNFEDPYFQNKDWKILNQIIQQYTDLNGFYPEVILFDEIQNIVGWEKWSRKFIDLKKTKLIITGSSAKMLSSELASALSGRALQKEIWPFSFSEYIQFKKININNSELLHHHFNLYLYWGGFPMILQQKNNTDKSNILKQYFIDIVYKDIISRNEIRTKKNLDQIINHYFINLSSHHSYSALKKAYNIPTDTALKYTQYLNDAFLIFEVSRYHKNLKIQSRDTKKVYVIDTGLRNINCYSGEEDRGKLLENHIYIELRRRQHQIFYYKNEFEVDFVICKNMHPKELIQVCYSNLDDQKTFSRELNGLKDAMKNLKIKTGIILTDRRREVLRVDEGQIQMMPAVDWLLKIKS